MIKLGVNIDHVATLRQARQGTFPDPFQAALVVEQAKGDGVTVHLREDQRHIQDRDVFAIRKKVAIPLNLEMAATPGMAAFASRLKPQEG